MKTITLLAQKGGTRKSTPFICPLNRRIKEKDSGTPKGRTSKTRQNTIITGNNPTVYRADYCLADHFQTKNLLILFIRTSVLEYPIRR
jgi:hypothetical protein